ncbi:MAG: uroporphyrinogen decarboxylase family protein [bacterium]
MSYKSGIATLNLEFTDTVPRTEYSAHRHWPLVKRVTKIDTDKEENREKASREFIKKWDYAFMWSAHISYHELEKHGKITKMGHAVYTEGGTDFDTEVTCPFKDVEGVLNFDTYKEYGEVATDEIIKKVERNYKKNETTYGNTVNMGGVYVTLFSGFIAMFGWDMFLLAVGSDKDKFDRVIESYYRWIKQYYLAYAKSNVPVFMCHDDICWTSGPVMSPDWYRKAIFPRLKKLLEPLLEAGKKIIFTSDGNYTEFFDDIVDCGAHMLVMEPSCDMKLFADKYGKTHGFVGNADTRILLSGTKEDIYNEVKRCMDIGKKYPGFIMAVGNHIPPNTPVDNALYYNEAYLELRER